MDASEVYSKRLNAKEVIFPKEKGEFIFPIADGRIKLSGGDQELRTPTLIQFEEKVKEIFLENEKGLFHHLTTRFRVPVKQLMISGPCQETSYTAITLNPESNFTRRLHTRIWMSSKSDASMIIGISMGLETCLMNGQVSLNLLYWKKNLPTDLCGPGGD